jgi:hypothetical protein
MKILRMCLPTLIGTYTAAFAVDPSHYRLFVEPGNVYAIVTVCLLEIGCLFWLVGEFACLSF